MADIYYPNVETSFIIDCAKETGKLEENGVVRIGKTISFIIKGHQAIFKRTCLIRELDAGVISYENATSTAIRLGFMGKLLLWFEENKGWKDGGYIEKAG
jgi:hypothetical protein